MSFERRLLRRHVTALKVREGLDGKNSTQRVLCEPQAIGRCSGISRQPGLCSLTSWGRQTLPAQLFKTLSRHSVLTASFQAGQLRLQPHPSKHQV